MVGAMDGMSDAMSMEYNYFTVNGKSYPATVPITVTAAGGAAVPSAASRSSRPVPSPTPMMSAMPGMNH